MNSFTIRGYIDFKKSYLKAMKAGKTWDGSKESILRVEKSIKELEKEIIKKEDKTANKKKVVLTEKQILEKRIRDIENLLRNDKFLSKVSEEVIDIKRKEIADLESQLELL